MLKCLKKVLIGPSALLCVITGVLWLTPATAGTQGPLNAEVLPSPLSPADVDWNGRNDDYLNFVPGESRHLAIDRPAAIIQSTRLRTRSWNAASTTIALATSKPVGVQGSNAISAEHSYGVSHAHLEQE